MVGIEDVVNDSISDEINYLAEYKVYNLSGVKVGDSVDGLEHGFYIVRQGAAAKKIAIK